MSITDQDNSMIWRLAQFWRHSGCPPYILGQAMYLRDLEEIKMMSDNWDLVILEAGKLFKKEGFGK